tara:strand:- start:9 stop:851 length:843 start_codon:yes stop_codon:yes gene_type:complete
MFPIKILIFLLSAISTLIFSSNSKAIEPYENINKRIISLNSLSADIVSKLDNNSLIGIPGSSLLKKDNRFDNKQIISEGRMPPSIEKIIKLKPSLVIGSSGFHDKILNKLNDLNIKTLKTNTNSITQLEKLIKDLANYLDKDPSKLNKDLYDCYKNTSKKRGSAVVLASTKPLLSPNSNSWAGKLLERFNFDNISKNLESKTEFKGYVNLSPEIILKSNPSKIILITFPGMSQNNLESDQFFNKLISSKNNKVVYFNYYGLINPGSINTINNACKKLSSI